jgi:hypothetical protein
MAWRAKHKGLFSVLNHPIQVREAARVLKPCPERESNVIERMEAVKRLRASGMAWWMQKGVQFTFDL